LCEEDDSFSAESEIQSPQPAVVVAVPESFPQISLRDSSSFDIPENSASASLDTIRFGTFDENEEGIRLLCGKEAIDKTAPLKTKNKKKSKKIRSGEPVVVTRKPVAKDDTVADDSDELYAPMFKDYPVCLTRSVERGRAMTAKEDIEAGQVIYSCRPYVAVVTDSMLESFCHECFETINRHVWCKSCKMSWYCSESCMTSHASHQHTPAMCSALQKLYHTSRDDTAIARLVLGVLSQRRRELTEGYANGETTYDDVLRLLSHVTVMTSEALSDVKALMRSLAPLLSDDLKLSSDDALFELISRVKCNHHGLDDLNNRRYGLGVFPRACFFNHCCRPNATYTIDGGILYVRAMCAISPGSEICLSYTDMYQVKAVRQQNLKETYFFECNCERCREPAEVSQDKYLGGFRCPISKCPGVLERVGVPVEGKKDKQRMRCSKCGEEKNNAQQLIAAEEIANAFLQRGIQLREDGLLNEARTTLEQLLSLYERVLHPLHSVLFHTYAGLMNTYNSVLDLNAAGVFCKKVLHLMESGGVYPRYHPDICAHYCFLGNSLLCLATTTNVSGDEQKALLDNALAAFRKSYEMLRLVRGDSHPASREVFAKISRTEQTKRMLI